MADDKSPLRSSTSGAFAHLEPVCTSHDKGEDTEKETQGTIKGLIGFKLTRVTKKFLPPPPVPPPKPNKHINSSATINFKNDLVIHSSTVTKARVEVSHEPSTRRRSSRVMRTRTVTELAQRFLEENVRNSIQPRIYPMSNAPRMKRVPTPFVFTSDIQSLENGSTDGESLSHSIYGRCSSMLHERLENSCYNGLNGIVSRLPLGIRNVNADVLNEYANLTTSTSTLNTNRISTGLTRRTAAATPTSDFALLMMSSPAHNSSKKSQQHHQHQHSSSNDFASLLRKWSAPIPPVLSRKLGRVSDSPLGKVKVMLRICDSGEEMGANGILGVDQRRKQVTLIDPGGNSGASVAGTSSNAALGPEERRVGVSAPKMFAFDGIFGEDDDQAEICAASAAELVASVVGGEDGCFVSLGYCTTGKKQTMFGRAVNQKMGVVPTAISWLFKSIQEQKQKTGTRFSVRVSALEVTGGSGHEIINDLLLPFVNDEEQAPSAYLLDGDKQESPNGSSVNGTRGSSFTKSQPVLNTVSEVRAPNPVAAGFFLDNAIAAMSNEDPIRHFVFTLHVYQYTIDKNGKGVVGGRSRLHCVMLGNGSPSISVLGGLLLAVLNGQRHLPSRESKLGAILRECLGSLTCRAVIMIHVGHRRRCSCTGNSDGRNDTDCDSSSHMTNVCSRTRYSETLAALQLGSRVHRLRRSRRLKMGSVSSGNGSGGSSGGSGEEMRNGSSTIVVGNGVTNTSGLEGGETGSSDIDPSSSDLSCDTVIYLGPSIDDATDGEHPPVYLPSLDGEDTGIEQKLISSSSKCLHHHHSLTNGTLPKSKSPKPKAGSGSGGSGSGGGGSGGKSEEQWVDGPKVAKYSSPNSNNSHRVSTTTATTIGNGGDGVKKCETWIDGPAAVSKVAHQSSNFPSPKKAINHHQRASSKMRLDNTNSGPPPASSCSISSVKAQMIQQWISNQTHSFVDSNLESALPYGLSTTATATLDFYKGPNSGNIKVPPYLYTPYLNPLACTATTHENGNGYEPEYKTLTVFKTCDGDEVEEEGEEGDRRHYEDEFHSNQQHQQQCNGYEFEFIEVVEPDVPVPMKDACLQVTEEDIALSFLEENPLPESDQNFTMGVDAYFFAAASAGITTKNNNNNVDGNGPGKIINNHHSTSTLASQSEQQCKSKLPGPNHKTLEDQLRCYDSSISSAASTCTLTERSESYHPLRVLSQECLTVVSTFADSASMNDDGYEGEDIERFWPRLSFPNDLTSHVHPADMCRGLCKNLVSLSQMSLNHQNQSHEGLLSPSFNGGYSGTNGHYMNPKLVTMTSAGGGNTSSQTQKCVAPKPPTLSDDSIYKVPSNPTCVKIKKMKNEASDTEEEGGIPPMKLLDLTAIKNNLVEESVTVSTITPAKISTTSNPITVTAVATATAETVVTCSTGCYQSPHPGCDHNHHQQNLSNANLIKVNTLPRQSVPQESDKPSPSQSHGIKSPTPSAPTSPQPLEIPPPEIFTKSPSKSKSRKIAKFFRSSRSKSPKKVAIQPQISQGTVYGKTSSSESGKSSSCSGSTISAETIKSSCSSSDSSSGLGSFPSPTSKPILNHNSSSGSNSTKSPKHQSQSQSPSRKSKGLFIKTMPNNTDHRFGCETNGKLPAFVSSQTAAAAAASK